MSDEKRSSRPPDLPHFVIGDLDLSGYKMKCLGSLTVPNAKNVKLQPWHSAGAKEAAEYLGHRPHDNTPFIHSLDRKALELILRQSLSDYRRKEDPEKWEDTLKKFQDGAIRETFVLMTTDEGWCAPLGGLDSRVIFRDGEMNTTLFPRWSRVLRKEDFDRIICQDAHAFLTALGFEPPLVEIPMPTP